MTPHGPDGDTFVKATAAELKPDHFAGGLAFMFETTLLLKVTPWALGAGHRDVDYQKCWATLPKRFTGERHAGHGHGGAEQPLPPGGGGGADAAGEAPGAKRVHRD